ncbi:exodeoxyribonuclease VII large subunit [Candidatus Saccharibacteria bacterium]|nr:exodeoxyribonuclease VII large subunit [Candidatus Saccharibacteria bacterium]
MTQPILSVSDFIAVVNQTLEYAYPGVEVEGEVASFKVNQDKFVFFDIKDHDGSVGCFMTVWQMRTPIEDGMKVIVSAVPKLTKWGKFSLTVKSVRPSGEGAIKKSFELLKAKLDAEGLFDKGRKRLLPPLPSRVAVVSSTQAAGYADFIKILNDRWGGVKIEVAQVQVQGESAPDQMIRAINYFNQQKTLPEVVVIIRGGGSADDLLAFNDESLVRAIARSRIPTVVGVGHETDLSLADMVADVRAATPSNAAQILVPDRNEVIRSMNARISSVLPRVISSIDYIRQSVRQHLENSVLIVEKEIDNNLFAVRNLSTVIRQLDPGNILARGYAMIRGDMKVGSVVEIETNKAILKAEVKNVSSK